jgi:two-component system response regulator ChvI
VVDDESDVIFTLKIVLEENGFKVDSFTDPLVALENFRGEAGQYDIILLDVKMPNINGFELHREIRKRDIIQSIFAF